MTIGEHKPDAFRFTLRGLLVLMAALAGILGLSNWVQGGLFIAIPLTAVPFALLAEYVFGKTPVPDAAKSIRKCIIRQLLLVSLALSVAALAWIGVSNGVPTLVSPLPFLVVIPLMYEIPLFAGLAIPVVVFLVLNVYHGRSGFPQPIPSRFPILLGVATVCSLWWFIYMWRYGMEYQGAQFTWGIAAINAVFVVVLWTLWAVIRRRANKVVALVFSTLLHWWLFWFAFPWLGELP